LYAMPKTPLRFIAALLLAVLTATACTSGDSDETVTDDFTPPPTTDLTAETGADEINPELVDQLGFSLVGSQLDPTAITCMVERADGDVTLTDALTGPAESGYQFTDQSYTALTVAVHACVDNTTLAQSLVALSGVETDAAQANYASCVAAKLDDMTTGDLAYVGLSALQVQFPVPAGAVEPASGAARECVPKEGIANQFAGAAEAAQQFTVDVDRECLAEGIDDAFLDSFWANLISGETNDLRDQIDGCSTPYDSGLAKDLPVGWEPWTGDGALAAVDPAVRNSVYTDPPPQVIDPTKSYTAVLNTDDGEIRIWLYARQAPETVNNFVALAQDGYYDGTVFHRVLNAFMAQGGDPTGTGTGGPGYSFPDEEAALTPLESRGLLAMANSGPDTNGSQFFITFDPTPHLNGLHAVLGEVVAGDDVLAQIDLRDPGAPTSRGEMLISVEIIEE